MQQPWEQLFLSINGDSCVCATPRNGTGNASAWRPGNARKIHAKCSWRLSKMHIHPKPWEPFPEVSSGGCCELLCFQRQGTAAPLSWETLGYLQEPLVNEDLNGDNCISTKAISCFSPISAVLNHQPGLAFAVEGDTSVRLLCCMWFVLSSSTICIN